MSIKIITNDSRTGAMVKRSWKKRLFSRPWRPLVKEKWDNNAGPFVFADRKVLHDKVHNVLYMNSKTKHELEKEDQKERHKETFRRSNLCGF